MRKDEEGVKKDVTLRATAGQTVSFFSFLGQIKVDESIQFITYTNGVTEINIHKKIVVADRKFLS